MHDSLTVANRFLAMARDDHNSLTPMQLLKLVYIAHGWHLGLTGRPLIRDRVEAWQYGPVIPRLYDKVRTYRGAPVTEMLPAPVEDEVDEETERLLDQVYERYGLRDGITLSKLTHAPGTPWTQVYEDGTFGHVISDDLIQRYYEDLSHAP